MEGFLLALVVLVSALHGLNPKEVVCNEAPAFVSQEVEQVVPEGHDSPSP